MVQCLFHNEIGLSRLSTIKLDFDSLGIKILSIPDAIRKRPHLYFGNTSDPKTIINLITQAVCLSRYSVMHNRALNINVKLQNDYISIYDDGVGFSIEEQEIINRLFVTLYSAGQRNYDIDRFPGGGALVAINALCEELITYNFIDGEKALYSKYEYGNLISSVTLDGHISDRGFMMKLKPDPSIFKDLCIDYDNLVISFKKINAPNNLEVIVDDTR